MTSRMAALVTVAGGALVVLGLAIAWPPAGIIAAGLGLAAIGLDDRRRP